MKCRYCPEELTGDKKVCFPCKVKAEKRRQQERRERVFKFTEEHRRKLGESQIRNNQYLLCGYKYVIDKQTFTCKIPRLRSHKSCRGKHRKCIHAKGIKPYKGQRYFPYKYNPSVVLDIGL